MKTMTVSKGLLLTAVVASALSGLARSYDVAAYVWPAYHPEPRWRELCHSPLPSAKMPSSRHRGSGW